MGQSYLKNAALLTGADVLLRLAGMGLRIYLANALGGEGMGLYQLVLAVYGLFVTLAATRRMAEELARGRAQARGMLVRLAGTGLLLGAEKAVGVDIDALAVKTAGENAQTNGVEEKFQGICGNLTDQVAGKYELVVANIVADIIILLTKDITRYLNPDVSGKTKKLTRCVRSYFC